MTNTNQIKIIPYSCDLDEFNNPQQFVNDFSTAKINDNIIEYGESSLLLEVLESRGNFVLCRLIKIRKNFPAIMNFTRKRDWVLSLPDDERLIEISHFIFNHSDKILFGQYNFYAVRNFAAPLLYYFRKLHPELEIKIENILSSDTVARLESENVFRKLTVAATPARLNLVERNSNQGFLGRLGRMGDRGSSVIEVSIRKSGTEELDKELVLREIERLMEQEDNLLRLRVETKNSIFDLLEDDIVSFKIESPMPSREIKKEIFFEKAIGLYNSEIAGLRRIISDRR